MGSEFSAPYCTWREGERERERPEKACQEKRRKCTIVHVRVCTGACKCILGPAQKEPAMIDNVTCYDWWMAVQCV